MRKDTAACGLMPGFGGPVIGKGRKPGLHTRGDRKSVNGAKNKMRRRLAKTKRWAIIVFKESGRDSKPDMI